MIQDRKVTVTVHSLGSVDAPATKLTLMDPNGKMIATVDIPALKAPLDLTPKIARVSLTIPAGVKVKGSTVVLDPEVRIREITRVNNLVKLN